ncbi:MAG TPA: PIG-L family deacetylase [Gaiellaceae bacterium]
MPIDIHPEPSLRLVVVSPHFDDGVLSIGAAIASWVRAGHRVGLLTVLGCDPESTAAAGGWDRRGGFATEGEAARARRAEDRRACETLRVSPMWLPYGSNDYERHGDENDVWSAISPTVADADLVFVPGFPLSHPDHAWLDALLAARLPPDRLGRYAEQPYTFRERGMPFAPVRTSVRDRVVKLRAIRKYASQLPLLGLGGTRGAARLAWSDERIAVPAVVGQLGSSLRER